MPPSPWPRFAGLQSIPAAWSRPWAVPPPTRSCSGSVLWWSARETGDAELGKAADAMLQFGSRGTPRRGRHGPFHQADSQEMWSDGSFTTPPFLAASRANRRGDLSIAGCAFNGYGTATKKLMHHRWSEKKTGAGGTDFSGVAATGLDRPPLFARVLRSLPADRAADRARLAAMLKELLDGCLAHQRKDRVCFATTSTTPSAFRLKPIWRPCLAYAIYESVRGGWLPEELSGHTPMRLRAAVRAKVDRFGFVQGVAARRAFDRPGISAEGQAFFILMEAAARKTGR